MKTSVVIYEDNGDFREALVQLINTSENFTCTGAFHHCNNVTTDIKQLKPQVILMDIDMNGMNGIEAVNVIRGFDKEVKIIILTVFDDNKNVINAICAGASGYLLKKYCFEKLFSSIAEVLEGGAPMSANIARMVVEHIAGTNLASTEKFDLTAREKDILSGLVKGYSYKMIASSLHISFETVKSHIRNIYEKLHVHNQSEAVAKALKNRIV
ncbi:MAG TPA: response regulator transcription factor [Mucilaginibacter sp.]|jgi:DNA-binding NarL/FixJ family response regulator|nr:response regulator transcription factor [Mucilaginibacter sp.]